MRSHVWGAIAGVVAGYAYTRLFNHALVKFERTELLYVDQLREHEERLARFRNAKHAQ